LIRKKWYGTRARKAGSQSCLKRNRDRPPDLPVGTKLRAFLRGENMSQD
jgi:hypothetical protein